MNSKVSVIIPCYNAAATVGETLDSVLGQTFANLQIVVVDDGSTDDSASVVREKADARIELVQQENRGQTAALNAGLARATGEFVQYLDADDLIDPDKIALQMARLADRPSFVASAAWGRFYTDPKETRFVEEDVYCDLAPVDWLVRSRSGGLGMMMPGLWLIPAPIVRAAGPWDESLTLNNDAEYFTRVLLASEGVLYCPGTQVRYRSGNPSSLSAQRGQRHYDSQIRVLDLCESYVRAREDSPRVRRGYALTWQHLAHICYPHDPKLANYALKRAASLDSVRIRPDGGPWFKAISRILGWRVARRLQALSGRA